MTRRPRPERRPAEHRPVARVCVDVPLAHLDRPFDYLVDEGQDADAVPGCRVRVRFAGQLVDGYLLSREPTSAHAGRLSFLERVVSPEPVLTPEVAGLARAVANRYAGTLADVLRLAVPPRHARVEQESGTDHAWVEQESGTDHARSAATRRPEAERAAAGPQGAAPRRDGEASSVPAGAGGWARYPAGQAFLRALRERRAPRAVWSALPGEQWPTRVAEAVKATLDAGQGALVVVADARDLDRVDATLAAALGPRRHVALSAALGPAERYRRFLAARRGEVKVVAGTRAAMFAPVADLGLVVIWDDGDDLFAEPRAPYPHAREVLLTRAQMGGAAALLGGYARSVEAQQLVETGWAREMVASRETVRACAPAVTPVGDDAQLARDPAAASARLPSVAWYAARDAVAAGRAVLVQVPRRGYLPAISCADCHTPARCPHCSGPLALSGGSRPPACRWCGRVAAAYTCPRCGGRRLRAAVVGARRTAEELGRAFPGVPVRTSGRDGVLAEVPDEASLVVATPGAEPVVAAGGYGAVLLLDTWALLTRADLRAAEETLRRWSAAAALALPGGDGGRVVVVADGSLVPVQALLRWDPGWLAARELADRRSLGFPPAVRVASVTGPPDAVADLLAAAVLPDGAELLGPVPAGDGEERMLVRVPRSGGRALAAALHAAAGVRTARKARDIARVRIDPLDLL